MARSQLREPCRILIETPENGLAVFELTSFHGQPPEPVHAGQGDGTAVVNTNQRAFSGIEATDFLVTSESELPTPPVICRQASQQPRQVPSNRFHTHRAEIDQAGDAVTGKQDVVVPDIAQTGL